MDDERLELIENIDKYRIGLDEVFAFRCRGCGKCCKNREDILLNTRDVYNIATALKLTHKQVVETYCDTYIGRDSRIPIVRLKPKGANKVCPLLTGSRCSVHSLKPTVCALFPLGRVAVNEEGAEKMGLHGYNKIEYILSPVRCGSLRKKQTVLSWLESFGVSKEDKFFIRWNEILCNLAPRIKSFEENESVTDKALDMLWTGVFNAVYIAYDTQKEFYPQFEANVTKILGLFEALEHAGCSEN